MNAYFQIGGWKLKYCDLSAKSIDQEFSKKLSHFSLDIEESIDLCFCNEKCASSEIMRLTSESLTIYDWKFGSLSYNVYLQSSNGYMWVLSTRDKFIFLAYFIDFGWTNLSLLVDNTQSEGTCAFEHLADIFSYSLLALGGIVLHGVVMEYQGRGIILSGPSGTGKTTHSNIWRTLGLSTIINGDRALCRCINGIWTVFGMPWCGTSGISQNRQVPIQAIVVLEQHSENIVKRLEPLEALVRMLPNTYAPAWEPALYNKMLDRLDEIISTVPIFLLQCRPDESAALLLKSALDSL